MIFFFFKQKTAYEMRISDWSSDVCSSDLLGVDRAYRALFQQDQRRPFLERRRRLRRRFRAVQGGPGRCTEQVSLTTLQENAACRKSSSSPERALASEIGRAHV